MTENTKLALYNYIVENYSLSSEAKRLVDNIISYVAAQRFVDMEDNVYSLYYMLNAIGMEEYEIRKAITIPEE